MAHIKLENLGVTFSIYNAKTRSIRNKVLSSVGGRSTSQDGTTYVHALKGVTLNISEGDRIGILGHNGSGKSTLLKVLAGIYEPTAGMIETCGSISALTDIAMGMDPENTGYQNIIMRCIFMGMTVAEAKSKIDEIIAFTELEEYIHLPMRTYSTGMYMRLALTIATCATPDILIMDEMIGAGDSNFLEKAKQRTLSFISNTKIVIISSHDINIIKELCNRVLWLEKGEIIAYGDVDSVCKQYVSAATPS